MKTENRQKRKENSKQNFDDWEKFISMSKSEYKIILSNYVQQIESEFLNFKSMYKERSPFFFIAGNAVKRDVTQKPIPIVEKEFLKYNDFNIKDEFFLDEIFAVDISSCYATVLHNEGYISKKTFTLLQRLPKLDRLGAIGMLAGNKKVFTFNEDGVLETFEDKVSELENYFYYAVKRTAEIMEGARDLIIETCAENYLFTWVDCIYFKEIKDVEKIINYFSLHGLKCTCNIYTQFLVKRKKKNFFVTFFDEKQKTKTFNIPLPERSLLKELENLILNKNK